MARQLSSGARPKHSSGARSKHSSRARPLPANTRRAPASARGTRTRVALVRAARKVFERSGFLDARITDITTEAGVAAGTFYTYFTSKEDAFAAVMEEVEEEMLHPRLYEVTDRDRPDVFETADRGHPATGIESADRDHPAAMIESANRAYLAAYRRNARLMALMEQVALVDEDFRRVRTRRTRAFAERNAQAVVRLQERGLADQELDPRLAALALSAMVSRMAYLRYVQGFIEATPDALTSTLTRLWTNALRVAPQKPDRPNRGPAQRR